MLLQFNSVLLQKKQKCTSLTTAEIIAQRVNNRILYLYIVGLEHYQSIALQSSHMVMENQPLSSMIDPYVPKVWIFPAKKHHKATLTYRDYTRTSIYCLIHINYSYLCKYIHPVGI